MEDNTLNQEQTATTSSEDEGFFDDVTEEDLVDTPITDEEESNTDNEQPTEEVDEEAQDDFLDIRYNKEDVRLNKDQAREYAQKGMNYDKLNERYSTLNSNLERLANANGLSVEEYLGRLEETQYNFEVSKEMEGLKEQYPDTNEEVLTRLAEQNVNARLGDVQRQRQAQFEQEQVAFHNEALNDLENFMAVYPDVDINNLPQEVQQEANETHNLTRAYANWRQRQAEINKPKIEAKQKAQELNAQNQSRSIGSTTNVGNAKQDDFLAGWDSAD